MKWLRDEDFIRGKIPMTKFEVRVLTIAMLDISSGDVFLDVGAGSGSISIQVALLGAKVFAVERESEGLELISKNAEKFNSSVNLISGNAPEVLENIEAFNKCFIGGSGGKLSSIARAVSEKLLSGGLIAGNFIIPDNMIEFKNLLIKLGYEDIEVRLIQCAAMDRLGLMKGQNPVYIVKGRKI